MGRGFWPLLASTPWTFAALCHPWLLKVVGGDVRPPRPLGSVCRAMAGQCSRNTEVCLGARRPLGQIRRISGPNASHAEGLPTGAGGGRSREWVSFPSTQVMAGRTGLLFLQSGLADRAAQVAGEGPRKENRKKEMKNQWLKYSVSRRVGLGGARAQPRRCPLHLEEPARGRLEFGRWLRFGGAGEGWQRGGRLEKLFDLLGPFHVICPRLLARQALDEVL